MPGWKPVTNKMYDALTWTGPNLGPNEFFIQRNPTNNDWWTAIFQVRTDLHDGRGMREYNLMVGQEGKGHEFRVIQDIEASCTPGLPNEVTGIEYGNGTVLGLKLAAYVTAKDFQTVGGKGAEFKKFLELWYKV